MYNYYSSIKTQCHANNIMQAIKKITQQGTDKEELKGAFQHVIRELTTYREATNPACWGWAWCHRPGAPVSERQRQEDCFKRESSLVCIACSKLFEDTEQGLILKDQTKPEENCCFQSLCLVYVYDQTDIYCRIFYHVQHRAQNTEQGTRVSKCILKVQVVRWTLNVLQETVLGMCNTGTAGFQSDSTIYTFTQSA